MSDFQISSQADELLYRDYKKMSLVSEIMFTKFLQPFKARPTSSPSQSLNPSSCQRDLSPIMDLFLRFLVFLSLWAAFYLIEIGMIYQKFSYFKHQVPFYQIFVFSE